MLFAKQAGVEKACKSLFDFFILATETSVWISEQLPRSSDLDRRFTRGSFFVFRIWTEWFIISCCNSRIGWNASRSHCFCYSKVCSEY